MTPRARVPMVEPIGVAGLYLFAFGAWLGVAIAATGLALMAFAALFDLPRLWPRLRASPWPVLIAGSAVALAASATLAWNTHVDDAEHSFRAAGRLLQLWLFVLVAWWVGGQPRRVWRVLAAALAGFTLGRLIDPDLQRVGSLLGEGGRPGFGLPALAFAQYVATALIGLCLALPRLWHGTAGIWRLAVAGAWLMLAALALQALLMTQARTVWAVASMLLAAVLWRQWRNRLGRGAAPLAAMAALTVGMLALANADMIVTRLTSETEAFRLILRGDLGAVDYGSVGLRVRAWLYGAELWLERPWLGWGPGSAHALFAVHPDGGLQMLRDFHSLYVDLAVQVGLAGSLPFAIGAALVAGAATAAARRGRLPHDLYLIVIAALALHLLAALTNTRVLNTDWRYLWLLFAGAATTFALHPGHSAKSAGNTCALLRARAPPC